LSRAGKLNNKIKGSGIVMNKLKKQLFEMFTQVDEIERNIKIDTNRSRSNVNNTARSGYHALKNKNHPSRLHLSRTQGSCFRKSRSSSKKGQKWVNRDQSSSSSNYFLKKNAHKGKYNFMPMGPNYVYESDIRAEIRNSSLKDFNVNDHENNSLGVIIDNLKPEL
jgi:hypothetical protein